MKTYTQHKLTDHMLRRLDAVVNIRKPEPGMSIRALKLRGLIKQAPGWKNSNLVVATEAGRQALAQARVEGW